MGIVLGPLMFVYLILSVGVYRRVSRVTQRKLHKYLTVAILILIPAWDVILGLLVFLPACLVVPKVAIYETAETNGIYYEGMYYDYIYELGSSDTPLSERIQVGAISDVFRKENYTYAEAKVTKRHPYIVSDYSIAIPPVYYRCTRLPRDPRGPQFQRTSCVVVDQPMSRYVVKVSQKKVLVTSIKSKKIYDRSTGKLMAEYRQVTINVVLPFFNWLIWSPGGGNLVHCPLSGRYPYFEFEVLKPKIK